MTTNGTDVVVVSTTSGTDYVNSFDYNKLKDRKYKAEDYQPDKSIIEGPMMNRRCTDCLFLIVWMAFLVGMMAMIISGYTKGDTAYMLAPIQSDNPAVGAVVCGYGGA
jgi:hypothetical protein